MRNKLAVFDLDGTLFNTQEVNFYSYAEAANRLGYCIPRQQFLEITPGKNYKEFLPVFGITDLKNIEQIHDLKKQLYSNNIDKVKKNSILFQLIETLKKDYIIALATTASRKNTLDLLKYFQVENIFEIIITQEDTKKLKPDPECYLLAMKKARVAAESTIIFEDSEIGLQAAKSSGGYPMKVSI